MVVIEGGNGQSMSWRRWHAGFGALQWLRVLDELGAHSCQGYSKILLTQRKSMSSIIQNPDLVSRWPDSGTTSAG